MAGQTFIQLTKKKKLSLDAVYVCACQDCVRAIEAARVIGLHVSGLESSFKCVCMKAIVCLSIVVWPDLWAQSSPAHVLLCVLFVIFVFDFVCLESILLKDTPVR